MRTVSRIDEFLPSMTSARHLPAGSQTYATNPPLSGEIMCFHQASDDYVYCLKAPNFIPLPFVNDLIYILIKMSAS